jgi:C-methyltransferase C-terminal domain
LVGLVKDFAEVECRRLSNWAAEVRRLTARGPVALWGAGAKGVTFANLVDPECRHLACVVDVNPRKQGKFLPGTGHPIVPPERLLHEGVQSVLVLNPNYFDEIVGLVRGWQSGMDVINLMAASIKG